MAGASALLAGSAIGSSKLRALRSNLLLSKLGGSGSMVGDDDSSYSSPSSSSSPAPSACPPPRLLRFPRIVFLVDVMSFAVGEVDASDDATTGAARSYFCGTALLEEFSREKEKEKASSPVLIGDAEQLVAAAVDGAGLAEKALAKGEDLGMDGARGFAGLSASTPGFVDPSATTDGSGIGGCGMVPRAATDDPGEVDCHE